MRFADLSLTRLEKAEPAMPWGFSIVFDERAGVHGFRVAFDAGLYEPDDVVHLADRLCRLLDLVSRHDGLPLRELVALSEAPARPADARAMLYSPSSRRREGGHGG
jgi:hypothetical protein